MKKTIAGAALFGALAVPGIVLAAPALADNSGQGGSGTPASSSGATHGAFADQNGNFGSLGSQGGTPGPNHVVGQDPGATGYNNSHVSEPPTITH